MPQEPSGSRGSSRDTSSPLAPPLSLLSNIGRLPGQSNNLGGTQSEGTIPQSSRSTADSPPLSRPDRGERHKRSNSITGMEPRAVDLDGPLSS
jgi:hypothetical protein